MFNTQPSFCKNGMTRPAGAREAREPEYIDAQTYGIIVEYVPSGQDAPAGPHVRRRRTAWDWHAETRDGEGKDVIGPLLAYWHGMRGNRVAYLVGPLGREKVVRFAEDAVLYRIDGSGVPATTEYLTIDGLPPTPAWADDGHPTGLPFGVRSRPSHEEKLAAYREQKLTRLYGDPLCDDEREGF